MFEMSDISDILSFSNILSLIAIIVSVISVRVAKNSLVFSQRSMLIKESYEPILNDIKHNQKIKFNTSKKMNFDQLHQISTSYLFLAFEEKDRELILLILELQKNINSYKEKVNRYASTAIAIVINAELQERNIKEVVCNVQIGNKNGPLNNNKDDNLYDLLLNSDLSICLETNTPYLWCDVGQNYTAVSPEGFEYEGFDVKHQVTLTYIFEKYFELKRSSYYDLDFISDFAPYEKKIIMVLKEMPEYKKAEKDYDNLLIYMNELESNIISKIKKLIIP
ncbi:hypothetical protein ACFVRR_17760 [Gottfriedia sp. NPDC057948]|uniref:hypothetical protein n=1 Tax=Gottfriedia sp. NPDC057948 TaxID=3346287 RepID=UPI0036DF306E